MYKAINQLIVFILELVMISSFACYGYQQNTSAFNKYLLALSLPFAAIIFWGLFAAPKAQYRFTMPYLAIFRGGMFLITSFLLYQMEYKKMAFLIFVLAIVTQIICYYIEK